MATNITFTHPSILESSLTVNGNPGYKLQTAKTKLQILKGTGLLSPEGELLGDIDWKARTITVGDVTRVTNEIKRRREGWNWGR